MPKLTGANQNTQFYTNLENIRNQKKPDQEEMVITRSKDVKYSEITERTGYDMDEDGQIDIQIEKTEVKNLKDGISSITETLRQRDGAGNIQESIREQAGADGVLQEAVFSQKTQPLAEIVGGVSSLESRALLERSNEISKMMGDQVQDTPIGDMPTSSEAMSVMRMMLRQTSVTDVRVADKDGDGKVDTVMVREQGGHTVYEDKDGDGRAEHVVKNIKLDD